MSVVGESERMDNGVEIDCCGHRYDDGDGEDGVWEAGSCRHVSEGLLEAAGWEESIQ